MDTKTLLEQFKQIYEEPAIGPITVGFSSIDPQKRKKDSEGEDSGSGCECDPNDFTDPQKQIINNTIDEAITNLLIQIDAGNVDPDAEEPEAIPAFVDPKDIDHEALKNLLGGDENGHYHLTEDEKEKLQSYPSVSDIMGSINSNHEKLTNLMGGNASGHYHLTNEEKTKLLTLISNLINNSTGDLNINHETLQNLLGGSANGHYHLTQQELNKLMSYPDYGVLVTKFNSNHEQLTNLLGGNTSGHYHLSNDEKSNLLKLITALIDSSSGNVKLPSDVESKLSKETWTFVLENDSTYTRDVAIWT